MLTYETVQKIGNLVGMIYTEFNGRCDMPDDPSDGTITLSGCAKYHESNGKFPPMLIFTGLLSGHSYGSENKTNSVYVLNLKTLKPTKNSYKKTELPTELKKLITSELKSI